MSALLQRSEVLVEGLASRKMVYYARFPEVRTGIWGGREAELQKLPDDLGTTRKSLSRSETEAQQPTICPGAKRG